MKVNRGLTLIEVLASTVLLAALAATVVPLMRHASMLAEDESTMVLGALERAADQVMGDPGRFGIVNLLEVQEVEIPWVLEFRESDVEPAEDRILVIRRHASMGDEDHQWMIFSWVESRGNRRSWGAEVVARWMEVPQEEDEDEDE